MFKSAGISSHIISLQVVFLFLLIPGGIFSQTYNLKKYSINEGLCNSQITCIMQDQRGFLWFGSYGGGISRFDGKEFRNFTEKDGLVHNTIRAMAEDKEGNIWIGTLGGGVCFFDGRNFHSMKDTLTGSSLMIYALMADKDGKIWAGTGSGLYVLDNNHFVRPEISGINENPVMSVIRDSENRLWFTSWDDGVYCVDGDNIIHLTTDDGISFNSVMQIYEAPNGTVWLSTFYGADSIPHFSPGEKPRIKKFTTVKELAGSQIFGILCDRSGNYWFADNKKGVYRITPGTPEKTLHIFSGTGLDSDVSYYLFEDVEGNIWISSWGTGVSMFSSELFVHYSISDGMKNKVVVGVTRYLGKTVMTDTRGVASVENGFPEIIGYEALRRSVYCICTDEDALWMGCNNALGRFMNGRLQFWELSRYSYLGEIKTVCRGKDGKIWMGCWGNGMLEFDGTTFTSMNEKYGLPPETYVYTSYCDRKGNIWFGCWSAGLVKVTNDTLILITDSARTGNPNITGIHEDSDGNILVSSFGGGISIMKNPADSLTERWQINESNGLADNVVHGLVFNADSSMLWVSTQKGLSVIDYGKFMKEGETDARFFGKSEGFVNIEATANASMYCDPEGYIWIGTKYGLTRCNPAAMRFNTIETRTHITGIRLFFEVTDWTVFSDSVSNKTGLPENLVLPWKENHLTFDFIGINSTSPEKVRYRFYLEGLDKDWSPATDRTEATYSSLSPGEYCFKVMAMNNDGVWNHEPACFSFKITPPFWQTTWFYIACSLVILLTFYAIYAVRTRKLKNDKIILEQKVKERTREIQQQKEEITAQRDAIMEQNEEITQQKEEIETQRDEILAQRDYARQQRDLIAEQNKEITDSIEYARRIQNAILPGQDILKKAVSDFFIYYLPRDIVSGDFYWFTVIEEKLIVAVSDCTGHGVPGAFMSMLGSAFLKEIVVNEYITHPGVILRRLRKEIVRSLQHRDDSGEDLKGESMKDGMDIALCSIDLKTGMCQYSGANNPLYIVRNSELIEIKGDKMPIAIYEKMDRFTTHDLQLEKDDVIYMFSDGYADQFGGPQGKKFKYKPFKQLLTGISSNELQDQKEMLEKTLMEWKCGFEQVDDILVIGLKIRI